MNTENMMNVKKDSVDCKISNEICHVELADMAKLKDITKKILCLLEEIQLKTHSKYFTPIDYQHTELVQPISNGNEDKDDCSIYKRLTRKCICFNQKEYNDFIIHFNEDTNYVMSDIGEIIKNIRILKKFLYLSRFYTKHALTFLNEGLSSSSYSENLDIVEACTHADICNVFENPSIVTFCLPSQSKYKSDEDTAIQILVADILHKLVLLEEGRRYLKFSSKITSDIKNILKKKSANLDFDTVESLKATLNLLQSPIAEQVNVTYYCKPFDKDNRRKFSSKCTKKSSDVYVTQSNKHVSVSCVDKECDTSIRRQKIRPEYTD